MLDLLATAAMIALPAIIVARTIRSANHKACARNKIAATLQLRSCIVQRSTDPTISADTAMLCIQALRVYRQQLETKSQPMGKRKLPGKRIANNYARIDAANVELNRFVTDDC